MRLLGHNGDVTRSAQLASVGLLLLTLVSCNKARPQLPTPLVLMETPPPPARLLIPVELPEPAPPEPEAPEPPAPPPTPARPVPAATTRPTEKPTTPPPAEATPPPVLRTAADTEAAERRVTQLLMTAQQYLGRISYRELNADARTHYDFATSFIRRAETALKARNYSFAEQLASRAVSVAGQLVKR